MYVYCSYVSGCTVLLEIIVNLGPAYFLTYFWPSNLLEASV